jgi:hypothetical protein
MQMKRKLCTWFSVALIVMLSGCGGGTEPSGSPDTAENIGQGGTVFRFEVTDDAGAVTAWNVHTDETTVGAALSETGLISGDMFDGFGLMVKKVGGLTADYDADGSWWEFFIDGEPSLEGVSSVGIDPEVTYAFVYRTD